MEENLLEIGLPITLCVTSYVLASIYPISAVTPFIPRKYNALLFSIVPLGSYIIYRIYFGSMLVILRSISKKISMWTTLRTIVSSFIFISGFYFLLCLPPAYEHVHVVYRDNFSNVPELLWAVAVPEVESTFVLFTRIFSLLCVLSIGFIFAESVLSLIWAGCKRLLRYVVRLINAVIRKNRNSDLSADSPQKAKII